MGVIQVVGTCLPIFMEFRTITLKTGLLTLCSVLTGLLGFALSALAATRKAGDRSAETDLAKTESQCTVLPGHQGTEQPTLASEPTLGSDSFGCVASSSVTTKPLVAKTTMATSSTDVQLQHDPAEAQATAGSLEGKAASSSGGAQAKQQLWKGILVALSGGLASSMLQFAFVFGDDMVKAAEGLGVPVAAAPMVVWLLAFNLAMIPNLLVSSWKIARQRAWGGFVGVPLWQQAKSCGLCLLMACFFMGHIHLYGAGAAMIGDLGAAIGWWDSYP